MSMSPMLLLLLQLFVLCCVVLIGANANNTLYQNIRTARRMIRTEKCFDVMKSHKCRKLINDDRFRKDCDGGLQQLCKRSCGKCGNGDGEATECSRTTLGCCESDRTVAKKDRTGSNCPQCKDKHPELCERHKNDCNEVGYEGDWMLNNCHKTCGICHSNDCTDDKEYLMDCPFWQKEGLCKQLPTLMGKHCKKSCQDELKLTC